MKKLKVITISILIIGLLCVGGYLLMKYFKPKSAGLKINTIPRAGVYINGEFVGNTPYTSTVPVGQITLKLIPDSVENKKLFSYETKLNLVPGIQTVIDREFGLTEESSTGDVISFDKNINSDAGLIVVSNPDNSQVLIDGKSLGVTPFNSDSVAVGPHKITIKSEGYIDRTLNVKTVLGLRLTLFAKLAKGDNLPLASPTPLPESAKTYVIINDTPTGFLRMRTEPGRFGEEIAELKPGSKYLFLERDATVSGWFKIQYQDPAPGLPSGITGWISNQYSTLSVPNPTVAPSQVSE